jgi:hypothetical protein
LLYRLSRIEPEALGGVAIELFSGIWFQRHTFAMLDQETLLATII